MSTYLVTGVAGFIGAALARALCAMGHEVIGVDNLTSGKEENIPPDVVFHRANCQDASLYTSILPQKKYDAIFHLAGQSSGEISFDDPVYDLRTNTESTLLLLRFALAVSCPRVIYASSMSVYGEQPNEPVLEEAPTMPLSFYGVGKLASEHYLRLYEQFGLDTTALRLFNVYGEGQNMDNLRQGMVSIFMAMMVRDGHIHVKGSPNRYRDFVHIRDVVQAFLACLSKKPGCGRVFNIGGSGRVQVGDLIEMLTALYPRPVTVEYSGVTAGDMFGIHADISMAAKCLGYEPEVSLEQGLKQMLDWFMTTTPVYV